MKFSIVVPSFRQAEYLPRTLDSILSQEGDFEIECLVEDGGSPDDSPHILADYVRRVEAGEYPVRCQGVFFASVSEPDRGQTHAINK
jgi:glycosyltransferase involved in cell wall biosynthesis